MKVLIQAYLNMNVGDDLFLHIIFSRYPHIEFEIVPPSINMQAYKRFALAYKNVVINEKVGLLFRAKRKFGFIDIDKKLFSRYNAVVHIAGSIFMENPNHSDYDILLDKEIEYLKRKKIPVFFLSCNFGPYYTQEYKLSKEKLFSKCCDICFRDKYSYDLFKHIHQARYAPDAVFTLSFPTPPKKPNTVGISVIDLESRPRIRKYLTNYQTIILNIAKQHLNNNKEVHFFAFCKGENDHIAIDNIIKQLNKLGYTNNIFTTSYEGDLKGFLNKYLSMGETVCSRFHSMILSVISSQPYLPLIYSNKITNVIQDLKLCNHYLHINQIKGDTSMNPTIDITSIKQDAQMIFSKLDKLLNENHL